MQRRSFISVLACGLVTTVPDAQAQSATKVQRVGFLTYASAEQSARYFGAFNEGLRALGYVDERNVVVVPRFGDGTLERLPDLAADLVRLRPDVIVTGSQPISIAAQRATTTIPVV